MKYEEEYKTTETKKDFINLVLNNHGAKTQTVKRRYYKLKLILGEQKLSHKNIKYQNEYFLTPNKKSFINKVRDNYPRIKKDTARRRYYDLKKTYGKQEYVFSDEQKEKPHRIKMLWLDDMKKYNIPLTRKHLLKNNFLETEINWLEDEDLL